MKNVKVPESSRDIQQTREDLLTLDNDLGTSSFQSIDALRASGTDLTQVEVYALREDIKQLLEALDHAKAKPVMQGQSGAAHRRHARAVKEWAKGADIHAAYVARKVQVINERASRLIKVVEAPALESPMIKQVPVVVSWH